jgi:hypothetical protein
VLRLATMFAHLATCSDLSTRDLEDATASHEACAALIKRFADVSAPGTGAAAILAIFAHVGSDACAWREGDISVEMLGAGDLTRVKVMLDAGGLRERLLPTVVLDAPIEELVSAIEKFPAIVADLPVTIDARCIYLGSVEPMPSSVPFEISERSISGIPPAPRDELDGAWDDALSA